MSERNNEALDRIWLQIHGDAEPPFDNRDHPPWADVSWCSEQVFDHDVEYVRADIAAEREQELAKALDAALSMIEHSLTGLINPDTKAVYRKGIDELALTPDGTMTLLKARAILEGKTNQ